MARYILYVAAWLAVASAVGADTVLLANGQRIDNVVTVVTEDAVTIRYSYGEVTLPATMVSRVDEAESSLERYLAREAALSTDREAGAAEWLDLALAARADGLDDAHRRALLRAAEFDPHLPAVAAPLRRLDYVLDAERGRWLPYEKSPAALALAAERERARRVAAAEEAERVRAARHERLVETLETALLAQVVEELTEQRRRQPSGGGIPVAHPFAATQVFPVYPPVFVASPGHGWPRTPQNRATLRELARRQPGSLLPLTRRQFVAPRGAHRSSPKLPSGD